MVRETDTTKIKQEEMIWLVRHCDLREEQLALKEYKKIRSRKDLWMKIKPAIKRIIVNTKKILGK